MRHAAPILIALHLALGACGVKAPPRPPTQTAPAAPPGGTAPASPPAQADR